jgi:uncharacterized alkaline shock family protein YloU
VLDVRKEALFMVQEKNIGEVSIENSVVATIATVASQEVDGVLSLGGKFSLGELLGMKDTERGVKVEIQGNTAIIDMAVKIEYGRNMYEAARELQKKVRDVVNSMTGMEVIVNVKINGVIMKEKALREKSE